MNMKIKVIFLLAIILVLAVAACAPGPNRKIAGFWLGVWHGLIAPITFIVSLFSDKVGIYDVHNSGSWYNFGFVLGAGLFLSGGILGRKKKK
jgi:hypothetical protein